MIVLEPHCGVSGDMLLGCLVDLGADRTLLEDLDRVLEEQDEYLHISIEKKTKKGVSSTAVSVEDQAPPSGRTGEVMRQLMKSTARGCHVSPEVEKKALEALDLLLQAEGEVHGSSPEEVHLHEAASADTVFDMLGFFLLLENLGNPGVFSTPLRVGAGHVRCAHGLFPVPVPAVTALMARGKIPFQGGPVEGELATPTGVALLLVQSTFVASIPPGRSLRVGYGAGTRDFEVPNVLRGTLMEPLDSCGEEQRWIIEAGIDDATGEEMGYALEKLREIAPEVHLSQGLGKKGRPFFLLRALCEDSRREDLIRRIFSFTSTLGVRYWPVERRVMERRVETREVLWKGKPYPLRVKISTSPGVYKEKPEFDDVISLLDETDPHA